MPLAHVVSPELVSTALMQFVVVAKECREFLGSVVGKTGFCQYLAAR